MSSTNYCVAAGVIGALAGACCKAASKAKIIARLLYIDNSYVANYIPALFYLGFVVVTPACTKFGAFIDVAQHEELGVLRKGYGEGALSPGNSDRQFHELPYNGNLDHYSKLHTSPRDVWHGCSSRNL